MPILFPDENRVICTECGHKLFEVKQVYSLLHKLNHYHADTGTYVFVCAKCGKEITRLTMDAPYPVWNLE